MALYEKIPHHRKGLVYISITALLWSSSGLFIKLLTGMEDLSGLRLILESIDAARGMKLKSVHYQCETGNQACRRLYANLGFSAKYDSQNECIAGTLPLGEIHD